VGIEEDDIMWFKNLTVFRLPSGWSRSPGEIETTLTEFPLQPCVGQNLQSRGWVAVNNAGQLVISQERQVMIALGTEEKLLPASVVNQTAEERIKELEQQKGFKIGRKHKREIKEQVQADLLPRAFSRRRVTRGWIDFADGWLVVDTSTPSRADDFTHTLRNALGELPVTPLQSEPSMSALMTGWLASGTALGAFDLDDESELTTPDGQRSTVRYLRHSLDGKDIAGHLSNGKVVTRLALTWNGRISLVINDKLQIRRLKFLDMEAVEDEQSGLDPEAAQQANFALMCGELRALLRDLSLAIGATA